MSGGRPGAVVGHVLGAYALLAGLPAAQVRSAYVALDALDVAALEVPLADALGEGAPGPPGRTGLPDAFGERWDVVVTLIPTVMRRLAQDPTYGLASADGAGRRAAVTDARAALELADEVAQRVGRPRVRAVQVHSAPGPTGRSDLAAFERSMTELLGVPAAGALLAVEHCDAMRPGRSPEKGFLEIDEEIAVLGRVADPRAVLTVNWGRSAIEGRSAATPPAHVRAAVAAGVLGGVMFSGVAHRPGPWGPPWTDAHPAPRGADPALGAPSSCLLGEAEIAATLRATGGTAPSYTGLKITVGASADGLGRRIAVARAALTLLRSETGLVI